VIGRFVVLLLLFFCLSFSPWGTTPAVGSPGDEFFESEIRPVLVSRCYDCHSSRATQIKGGLSLETRDSVRQGGDSGAAIVPGRADESLLVQALRYDGLEMPPDGRLPDEVVAKFVEWVNQGAPDPRAPIAHLAEEHSDAAEDPRAFWSFQPIQDPPIPSVKDVSWPSSSIDAYVLARLESKGISPAARADKRTLIRRATFDLVGLPPTPAEVDAFVRDESPLAFSKVVDRLLASPHCGERWARHWLDVARYAEDQAHSFQPRLYPNGFRYRDWVVSALNRDMPYDRFVTEQIAGDLTGGPGRFERLPALGFLAVGPVYYGDKLKFDQLDDRIDTLSRGFLGLTVACARCHDHKYDPIPTADYYSLAGVFASTEYAEAPLVPQPIVDRYDKAQKSIHDQEKTIKTFMKSEAERLQISEKEVETKLPEESKGKLSSLRREMQRLQELSPPMYPVAHAMIDGSDVRNLRINVRGNPESPGEEVPRRFLSVLAGDEAPHFTAGSGRLELAEAIACKENPLTARVIVNRVWQHFFGRGLVGTPSNFGALGERPTHPQLLDHLASRFMASGWSIKSLQRDIVLSSTYALSSRGDPMNDQRDPDNRLLWRMNRRRLEVEAWRDAMLAVSDDLDTTLGGASVDLSSLDNQRRTLYSRISRHDLDSLLRLFDFPEPNITAASRSVTTVPLQQLFVLNSPFMVRRAKRFAANLSGECGGDDADRIRRAFSVLFSRPPSEQETRQGLQFLARSPTADESDTTSDSDSLTRWEQYAQVLLSTNEAMYID
jgi:hypothetical protein